MPTASAARGAAGVRSSVATAASRATGRSARRTVETSGSVPPAAGIRRRSPAFLPDLAGLAALVVGCCLVEEVGELALGRLPPGGNVLGRDLGRAVVLEHLAGDGDAVDLVGTVVQAGGPGVAVHRL